MSVSAKKEYPDGYPADALEVIRVMSFSNGKNVNIVGSMSLRSQIYAGDYDAYEVVEMHGIKEIVVKDLVRQFKQIIKDIRQLSDTYISDIKSGSIDEWVIIDDEYNYENSIAQLEKLHKEKIIDDEMYRDGKKRIKPRVSKLDLLSLRRDFRPNIIRWKPREVLLGFKVLKDGRKYTLAQAFESPVITKIDVVSWVQNNRFTDFSMIYQFKNNGKLLNSGLVNVEESIRENIFMLFHDGNYFKMAKRMFALAKYKGYDTILEKLSILFNGDAGRVYMIYGDIGTLESLLESTDAIPYKQIEFEIDQLKGRLSNIGLQSYIRREHEIFRLIDKLIHMRKTQYSREHMEEILNKIKTILSHLLSTYAKQYLIKMKIMPKY